MNSSRYMDEVEASQSMMQSRMETNQVSESESDHDFYEAFAKNITNQGMI